MDKQSNSSSPSWYPGPPMKDECSSTHSCRADSSPKRLKTTFSAPVPSSGLMETALEIEKLTKKSCCLQREIDAMMREFLRIKNSLEDKMMRKRRAIRTFGSLI